MSSNINYTRGLLTTVFILIPTGFFLYSFLFHQTASGVEKKDIAITYSFSGGRFGDNLIAFSHAAWLSYSMDLTLVYRPFPYSDQLTMDVDVALKREEEFQDYERRSLLSAEDYLNFLTDAHPNATHKKILYDLKYFPESAYEYDQNTGLAQYVTVDWSDPDFKILLQKAISPLSPNRLLKAIDPTRVTVALHVRKGGGFDPAGWELSSPLKAPPDLYYDSALTTLATLLKKPLYVYIFTDHQQPKEIQDRFEKKFSGLDMVFHSDALPQDVIDDFFALGAFEYLIRPDSNYSVMASHLFPYHGVLFPSHYRRPSSEIIEIDRIRIQLMPIGGIVKKKLEIELRN